MSQFLNNLNPEQTQAVKHVEGPLLVLAGAGSGKTRVITNRIGYLIERSICTPENILSITFTNKAANEMKSRLKVYFNDEIHAMTICTNHSLGNKILRQYYKEAGLPANYRIMSENEKNALLKRKLREITPRSESIDTGWISSQISRAKGKNISPADFSSRSEKGPIVKKLFLHYEEALQNEKYLDFDDLLVRPLKLLNENKDVLRELQERYTFISVDEYQDTNRIQFELIKLLSSRKNNLCAVGDDDQAIYGWRGADVRNILDFKEAFPGAKIIKLERNYRSTENILQAANAVISKNKDRTVKAMWSDNGKGDPIETWKARNDRKEAEWVANKIAKMVSLGQGYNEIAVLYRNNSLADLHAEELRKKRIPFKLLGQINYYNQPEIQDLLPYIRFIANESDAHSLEKIIGKRPWSITRKSLDSIIGDSRSLKKPLWAVINRFSKLKTEANQVFRLRKLSELIRKYRMEFSKKNISDALEGLVDEIGYRDSLKKRFEGKNEEAEKRIANLDAFIRDARSFENGNRITLDAFLREISILSREEKEETSNGVTLTTVHSSKGMEFPTVFVVGLDDQTLPDSKTVGEGRLDEERRLFYVAMTRAEKRLYLCWPGKRMHFKRIKKVKESRFVADIPVELMKVNRSGKGILARAKRFGNIAAYKKAIQARMQRTQKGA